MAQLALCWRGLCGRGWIAIELHNLMWSLKGMERRERVPVPNLASPAVLIDQTRTSPLYIWVTWQIDFLLCHWSCWVPSSRAVELRRDTWAFSTAASAALWYLGYRLLPIIQIQHLFFLAFMTASLPSFFWGRFLWSREYVLFFCSSDHTWILIIQLLPLHKASHASKPCPADLNVQLPKQVLMLPQGLQLLRSIQTIK